MCEGNQRDRPVFPSIKTIARANSILRDWLADGKSDRTVLDESVDGVVTRILRLANERADA